jgi:hypothetical protein
VPLAANAASPGNVAGSRSGGTRVQLPPPSFVVSTKKCPSIGSLSAIPCCASQNASASRKTPFCVVAYTSDQCAPASVVR